MPFYEEVTRMPPIQRKLVLLVGKLISFFLFFFWNVKHLEITIFFIYLEEEGFVIAWPSVPS